MTRRIPIPIPQSCMSGRYPTGRTILDGSLQAAKPSASRGYTYSFWCWHHAPMTEALGQWLDDRRRRLSWISGGLAVASAVVLRELGLLLQSIHSDQSRSYSVSVYTGLNFTPWNSNEIHDAFKQWVTHADALSWVKGHLIIDAVTFAPAYCMILYLLLSRVGAERRSAAVFSLTVFVLDELETLYTLIVVFVVRTNLVGSSALSFVPWLSLGKWLAVLATLVAILTSWMSRRFRR